MPSLNRVMLIGHLGKDPEMRTTQTGKAVANFSIATNEKYGETESTSWHKIVVWGKLAEVCGKYLGKGQAVYLEGRLQYRQWKDRDGASRESTEVVANHMVMLGAGKKQEGGQEQEEMGQEQNEDQVPF